MRRIIAIAASLALAVTSLAALNPPAHAETIRCSEQPGGRDFYPGPSASRVYNAKFVQSHAIPQREVLNGYIPQGLATWPNWGGKGKDLLLLTAYNDNLPNAILIGLVPGGGKTKVVKLPKSHVSGVAVVNGHLFVSGSTRARTGNNLHSINRYSLAELRTKLKRGGTLRPKQTRWLNDGGGSSFLAPEGNVLWAGRFSSTGRERMYRYAVRSSGALDRVGSVNDWIEVPTKTQGLVVTATDFVFSTSWTREAQGNVYVMSRRDRLGRQYKTLDAAYPQDLTCFRSPSMAEGITRSNGNLYLNYESGSYAYFTSSRNPIKHLHRASLDSLTRMT